jgi:phosphoglycerate dehydrogenase-like enzyme
MKIWSNTRTLDGYVPEMQFTDDEGAAEVALVGGRAIDVSQFSGLRGIFKTGVGRDNVPEAECRKRGIVCGFPSAKTCAIIYEETADFACHMILKCMYSEVGDFENWIKFDRHALSKRELLVVGVGNIGGRVVRKMQPFTRISTFDILMNKSEELESLVRKADCVTLHIPLSEATRKFIDAEQLAWMRDGAWLVNTARAAIVDEDALFDELSSGRLRAAFDVFWEEPYRGKLLTLPPDRFFVTPHIASTCREFVVATAEDFRTFVGALEAGR